LKTKRWGKCVWNKSFVGYDTTGDGGNYASGFKITAGRGKRV